MTLHYPYHAASPGGCIGQVQRSFVTDLCPVTPTRCIHFPPYLPPMGLARPAGHAMPPPALPLRPASPTPLPCPRGPDTPQEERIADPHAAPPAGLRPTAASLPDIDAAQNLGGWTVAALCRSLSLDNILTFLTAVLLERQVGALVLFPGAWQQ